MESCAKSLKRVTLELGGNDAAVVCEDVDLEEVIPKVGEIRLLFQKYDSLLQFAY